MGFRLQSKSTKGMLAKVWKEVLGVHLKTVTRGRATRGTVPSYQMEFLPYHGEQTLWDYAHKSDFWTFCQERDGDMNAEREKHNATTVGLPPAHTHDTNNTMLNYLKTNFTFI